MIDQSSNAYGIKENGMKGVKCTTILAELV